MATIFLGIDDLLECGSIGDDFADEEPTSEVLLLQTRTAELNASVSIVSKAMVSLRSFTAAINARVVPRELSLTVPLHHKQARYEDGHGGYSGTIAEKNSFKTVTPQARTRSTTRRT